MRRIAPLIGRERWAMSMIVVCSMFAGLAEAGVLALLAASAAALSIGTAQRSFRIGPVDIDASTSALLAAAAVLAVLRLILQIELARLPVRLSGAVQNRLRTDLVDSYLAATWAEKATHQEGYLQELTGMQTTQAGNAVLMLTAGLGSAFEFLMLVVSALVLSVAVSALIIVSAALLFVGLRPMSRRVRRRAKATSAASLAQASGVAESVRMAEEVEVFGAAGAERTRLVGLVETFQQHFVAMRSLSRIVPIVYQSAVIFLLIGGLAFLGASGTTRLAALGAVVLMLVRASTYGQQLQVAYQGVGEALPYLDRVSEAAERFRSNRREAGHREIGPIRSVEFRNVEFEYRRGVPVLQQLSFALAAGESIGVVGPSGAGKSTLLQLLLRLRDPSTGRFVVNDIDARLVDDIDWHKKVAFLPQEPHLLNDTVAQNVRFFRDWIDDAAVERAARMSHIHDDIITWAEGYRTVVGQRSDAVSGGQRQRICLARALAGAPELLLLDEPTSSLDLRSERLIQESLEELRGSLTLIVVAHRVSTLSVCDRVMVIRSGRLESFGPADLVYDSNEFYRESVDLAAAGILQQT
jgi:ABC-type multidrug transport system fused ATPase/permease subunit